MVRPMTDRPNVDFESFRLRNFVESLRDAGELEIVDTPTDYADVAAQLYYNPRAVWFRNVGPEGAELVGNVVASRSRIARAFGVAPEALVDELQKRLRNTPEIIEVSRDQTPVQQIVLMGDEADVTQLPVHVQHAMDGGPFMSAPLDFSIDPKTGRTNSGFRRLMLRGKHETGVDLHAPTDLKQIYIATQAEGNRLPVSFVLGCHPIDMVSGVMKEPVDELGLISSLRGAPLPVVKCITNDIRVPADAEWVIEGYFDELGYREHEGPYGEYLGYYGLMKTNPVFHVTAITRRHDALFQTLTISGKALHHTDTSNLEALRMELAVWEVVKRTVTHPVAVHAPVSAGGSMSVRVAIKPTRPGDARHLLFAILSQTTVKHAYVVNDDIDITKDAEVEWAMGTRFQADRDIVILTDVRVSLFDPSLNGARTGSKAGFDLTWAPGQAERWELELPVPPTYAGDRFASIEAALRDGPKRFEQLMAAVGSRDGREVVRELDGMRESGLKRDDQGRYYLE